MNLTDTINTGHRTLGPMQTLQIARLRTEADTLNLLLPCGCIHWTSILRDDPVICIAQWRIAGHAPHGDNATLTTVAETWCDHPEVCGRPFRDVQHLTG